MNLFRCLLAGCLLGASLPLAAAASCEPADEEALRWLDRMSRSLREVSYEGVFTYEHGQSMQAMRISHSVEGDSETEELTGLSGNRASIVRADHPLDCIHPGHRLLRIAPNFGQDGESCGLGDHYRLRLSGEKRIAGRSAVILQIKPRDMYRYGYQVALDRETGLLLKSQTLAHDGAILERFQFADIRLGKPRAPGTRVDIIHHAAHPEMSDAEDAKTQTAGSGSIGPGWQVRWIPEGFMRTQSIDTTVPEQTFTDGLAVFSVYIEPGGKGMVPGEGRARLGATTAYTRGRELRGEPVLITVVGEVPINTARIVANKIVWAGS